ncbi:MAG: chromosomal replication initiator protein DnaA, partial [Rhodospirillaceae bacterium]
MVATDGRRNDPHKKRRGDNGSDAVATEIQNEWEAILSRLRAEVGETAFQSWLRPMRVRGFDDGWVRISVPTRFMRDWAAAHYEDRLAELLCEANGAVLGVDIVVHADIPDGKSEAPARADAEAAPPANGGRPRDSLSAPLDKRFTFDQFVVGKPNEFAYAAARRVGEAAVVPFNPLFLYGGVGLGKTHLMHAIAWHVRQSTPERSVLYLSAEKFMYRFIRALREQNTVDFKEQFRSVDVLMIDDVQFIAGKDSTQEEFFHTFNALVDQGRQIVISSDKSPSDLKGMEERLVSRLNCGLVADI